MSDNTRTVIYVDADTGQDELWLAPSEAEGCALYVGAGSSFDNPSVAIHFTRTSAARLVSDICSAAGLTDEDFEEGLHG